MKILLDVKHQYSDVRDEIYWFIWIEFVTPPNNCYDLIAKSKWYTLGSASPTPEKQKTLDDCFNDYLNILEKWKEQQITERT